MSTEERAKGETTLQLAEVISLETVVRQRVGRPWRKGQSGNPSGKPRGALSKKTLCIGPMKTLKVNTPKLMKKAIEMALDGDSIMLKFLLERVLPRERLLALELPRVRTASDALEALGVILRALGEGLVTPTEGAALSAVARGFVDVEAVSALREEVAQLQEEMRARGMTR
jgi:hypothetical protein